jgi:hypothetical protein
MVASTAQPMSRPASGYRREATVGYRRRKFYMGAGCGAWLWCGYHRAKSCRLMSGGQLRDFHS